MAILIINIEVINDIDWDGNPIQFKKVNCTYDGALPKQFSYPSTISDDAIRTEVETKLRDEGYIP